MGIPAPFDNMECGIPSPFKTVGMASPDDASNCKLLNSVEMAPPIQFGNITLERVRS